MLPMVLNDAVAFYMAVTHSFRVLFRRVSQNCEKRLSAIMEQHGSHWTDFHEIRVLFFGKHVENIQV
jgi:hypothetical protein